MKVAINGRPFSKETIPVIEELFRLLANGASEIFIQTEFRDQCRKEAIELPEHTGFSPLYELPDVDFAISLGGDGTLLDTVTYLGKRPIPILGVNTGRLGYLATTKKDQLSEALGPIFEGYNKTEERSLVSVHIEGEDLFEGMNFALNEVAILKRDTSSMIIAHTYVNGEFLTTYWSDGVLVSTPTGSTGYSMSCGGPLVLPTAKNLILAPVCPHNLNLRPMILPDDVTIDFEIEGRTNNFLISLDSRSVTVASNIKLTVKKADFNIQLFTPPGDNYFQTLREKLSWGRDIRN